MLLSDMRMIWMFVLIGLLISLAIYVTPVAADNHYTTSTVQKRMEEKINQTISKLNELESKLNSLASRLSIVDSRTQDIKSVLDRLYLDMSSVKRNLRELMDMQLDLDAKISFVRGRIVVIDTKVDALITTFEAVNARLIEIKNGIAKVETIVGRVEVKLSDLDAKIIAVNGTTVRIETSLGKARVKLDDIGAEVVKLDGGVALVRTDLGELRGRVLTIENNIATIMTELGVMKISVPQQIKEIFTIPVFSTVALASSATAGSGLAVYLLRKFQKPPKGKKPEKQDRPHPKKPLRDRMLEILLERVLGKKL